MSNSRSNQSNYMHRHVKFDHPVYWPLSWIKSPLKTDIVPQNKRPNRFNHMIISHMFNWSQWRSSLHKSESDCLWREHTEWLPNHDCVVFFSVEFYSVFFFSTHFQRLFISLSSSIVSFTSQSINVYLFN